MEWNPFWLTKLFCFLSGVPKSWCKCYKDSQSTPPPLVKKSHLFWGISSLEDSNLVKFLCFCARACETWPINQDTIYFDKPNVSPITSTKVPEAKMFITTRTCTIFNNTWFQDASNSRSSWRSSDKNSMDSQPKWYELLNSSSVKSPSREKSSGSLNILSLPLGTCIKPTPMSNKLAIFFCFVLGEFSLNEPLNNFQDTIIIQMSS